MKRVLLCLFCVGLVLFVTGMVAISLATAGFEVPHNLIVWTLLPGMAGASLGSLRFSKHGADTGRRGFDVVQRDDRGAG
jgi:hypothetical protein